MAATRPRVGGNGWLRRFGVPVVGVWLALLVALVASAGGAQAAATTRAAPFTVETNLKLASGFNADELNAFVKKYEASSPLAKYGTYFVQAEQKSGVNAQALLAIAINQTSWGTAGAAKQNNFFAIKGKTYSSASAGILDGAAWINTNYLTKGGAYYVSPTLKGMAVHYTTTAGWATQVATIADRIRGAAAAPAPAPTAAPKAPAPTPCPPSSGTCKPAPVPTQAPQPQPSCVPAMRPENGAAAATMALPCNPTPNGQSDNAGGNGNGPNDAPAQGGVTLPPEGSDGSSSATASPAATAQSGGDAGSQQPGSQAGSQGTSQGESQSGASQGGAQAAPAPSQSPASAGITMAGSVRRVAQSGGALVPLLAGLALLIGGLVAVVIARRRPTF